MEANLDLEVRLDAAAGPSHALIQCEGVGKRYRLYDKPSDRLIEGLRCVAGPWLRSRFPPLARECWALRNVSFEVGPGESVAIIGRNGSGKSTLLQLVAGTLTPTEGSLRVAGRVSALLELGVGFHPEFSGLENIRTYAAVLGMTAAELDERFEAIVDFADIGQYISQPVKTYSSGMYVRLAFSVAIHAAPDILIVDEALAVGDIAFQAKCMARIRHFQEAGGTLLFVSHDVATAKALCQRAIYLEQGQVKDCGPAGPVVDHYLRDVHEAVNQNFQPPPLKEPTPRNGAVATPRDLAERFVRFEAEFAQQRQGTGEARIRLAEMVDEAGRPIEQVGFGVPARIRIWVECLQVCSVSVNYKIRDRHLVSVAGADLLITGHDELPMQAGGLYLVEYVTRLALQDGNYTLRFSVTQPIARHEHAVFLDIVEIALPFKVLPSPLGKIYTCVYLPNAVSTRQLAPDGAT